MKPQAVIQDTRKVVNRIIEIITVKGGKSFEALTAYWQPEYRGRRLNRQINRLIDLHQENSVKGIQNLLSRLYGAKSDASDIGLPDGFLTEFSHCLVDNNMATIKADQHDQLIQSLANLKSSSLTDLDWRALQFIATANGLFIVGLKFRDLAVDSMLGQPLSKRLPVKYLKRYFNAAMDNQDFEKAQAALNHLKSRDYDQHKLGKMELHFHLMQGHRDEVLKIAPQFYRIHDQEFADFVRGKRIAIVGPAPSDDQVAEEIDQFDIVIRTNYRGASSLPPAQDYGSKIDVSYYNYTYTKQVLFGADNAYLDDLKFAIFKNQSDLDRYRGRPTSAQFRLMNQINEFIFNGKSQMMQNIIYDLLHFEPAEIKLFKSNFFMSNQRYHANYASPTNREQQKNSFWLNFATHDLVTQHHFTQQLANIKNINIENSISDILQMKSNNYCKEIQTIYSSLSSSNN